ncbi:hypothetical protein JD508_17830 [Aeromonas jandaei]|uniref:hypothetical protein n=1 Tax=Aeromonas jandaei TaxID=650 RepID=UPI0019201DC8|nr:hypothetical protein [Aeromonas jandaei]MBL0612091.1 hypothetical protein [Aeromonas jandaei]
MKYHFLIAIAIPLLTNQNASANTLIKEYVKAKREEPYGDEQVGYPQVCLRVNLDEKIDMPGIINELIVRNEKTPENLVPDATNLAGSGYLGHAWTLFFDRKDSWRSWSFRQPKSPLGDALNYKNTYDSPSRKFTYQYCVNAERMNIETQHLLDNQIKKLVNESREIASSLMPDIVLTGEHGIYSPLTPCVWFAVNLFNSITGENIPYEQPINGKLIANATNNPAFEKIDLTVDASTVYEALSKQIIFSFGMSDTEQYMFLKNNKYLAFVDGKPIYFNKINKNMYYHTLLDPLIKKSKTAMLSGSNLYIVDNNGLFSVYDIKEKKLKSTDLSISSVFNDVDNEVKINAAIPLYKGMPDSEGIPELEGNNKAHLVFTTGGEVYLADPEKKEFKKHLYFETTPPEIIKYASRIVGSSAIKDGNIFIYLTKGKFIEIDRLTMDIIGVEQNMSEHPILGDYFKLQ